MIIRRPGRLPANAVRHEEAARWCVRLGEGSLSAQEQDELDRWLVADSGNPRLLERALSLWGAVELGRQAPEMIELRARALDSFQGVQRWRWLLAGRRRWGGLAVAASLLLGLGILLWRPLLPMAIETAVGEGRRVMLADGSAVTLDADTRVLVRMTEQSRELTLVRGRASFDVAKNPLRPFSVRSGDDTVVATGTSFSVEKLAGQVRVVLYEGHVAVLHRGVRGDVAQLVRTQASTLTAEQALTPGHALVIPTSGAAAGLVAVEESAPRSWQSGQLEFNDEPLLVAAERVNRHARGRRIEVAPEVANLPVSGVFNAGDVDAFAYGVTATFRVRLVTTDDRFIISGP